MALRGFIEELDRRGGLVRVSRRVRLMHELGAMARRTAAPVLFENIDGYPGMSVFTNGLSSRQSVALSLGLEPSETSWQALARQVRHARRTSCAPRLTRTPSALEERYGDDVDLALLPVPWWHEADAGRYVGTWHVNLTRDPCTGGLNAGVYRMLVSGKRHTTVSVSPRSHLACHMHEAERRGRPLAMAVAIGVGEPVVIAAAAALGHDRDELAFAGGLMGEPLEVGRCALSALPVPVEAEVVMEGVLVPGARTTDGPFMDYAGKPDVNHRAFVYEVRRLAWRPELVYRGTSVGRPGAEDHLLYAMLAAAGLADFHGSPARRVVQNALLRLRLFRLFQMTGGIGRLLHREPVGIADLSTRSTG